LIPSDLSSICTLHARPDSQRPCSDIACGITLVTAFFDIGRAEWTAGPGLASRYRRSATDYLHYFENLARLRNNMVIFTQPDLLAPVLAARRAHGLEQMTTVVAIDDLFATELLRPALFAIGARMTDRFRRFVWQRDCPEYREPAYVLINALKSSFVNTALALDLVPDAQTAWIDFGYCRDASAFDPQKPWRFDAAGKINLFHASALDDLPIFDVVRSGKVYFQGCHIVGPNHAWGPFGRAIGASLEHLLAADLVDDDQTLLLMAWRGDPTAYRIHAVPRGEWFVAMSHYNVDTPLRSIELEPAPIGRDGPVWREEFAIAAKRQRRQLKARLRHGFRLMMAAVKSRGRTILHFVRTA
jgi:protein YibB